MKGGSVKRHIVVALPSYAGTIHIGTMRSLMHDLVAFMKRGDVVTVSDESCNTEIAVARALMVSRFLRSQGTHLIMVDHDVMWQAGGMLQLVDHDEDCVAGLYPQRLDPISFPIKWHDDAQPGSFVVHPGGKKLLGVGGVPGGFLCLSRGMLERMVVEYRGLVFKSNSETTCDLFDRVRVGEHRLSEDYSFCHRWRAMGGTIWLDPDINMGHVGLKVFQGKFGDWQDKA